MEATADSGPGAAAGSPAVATAKPVNAIGLLFSVLWARVRRVFGGNAQPR